MIESLSAHRAGIHPQRAADRRRHTFHPFESAQIRRPRRVSDLFQLRANPRGNFVSVDVDLIEVATRRVNNQATNSAIAHQQVGAAADDKHWNIFAPAKLN